MNDNSEILRIENLSINYRNRGNIPFKKGEVVEAVRGVTFKVNRGEIFAIVGESGSGKTSIAMAVLRFVKPDMGRIIFKDTDIWGLRGKMLRKMRRKIQPVFQDSEGALNPRMTAIRAVSDGFSRRGQDVGETLQMKARSLFKLVGLGDEHRDRYPHELSGGQKQRICIARALAPDPELLVLDEPLSSQDPSIQARLIDLLLELKRKKKLTFLLISHDLWIVRALADRVAVMQNGIIVEEAGTRTLFRKPQHPHTQSLLENSISWQGRI